MTINNYPLPGVVPGKGFKEALLAPLELKPFVMNESRLEDGTRIIVPAVPKKAMRSFTLEFQITADTKSLLEERKNYLFSLLYQGRVDLRVPELSPSPNDVYRLVYTGKSPSYTAGLTGLACKVKVGFDEPDPEDRREEEQEQE